MEILNLFGLFFFFYFIFSISFLNKILLFISFCSLINCYINKNEMAKSSNMFVNLIGKTICFGSYCFDIFYKNVKKIEKTDMYKYLYNILYQFNKYYIEGRNVLIINFKKKMNDMIEKNKFNSNDDINKKNKIFKNDNDMFDFLNELDSELEDKDKKNI